jgi:hypothetical protein
MRNRVFLATLLLTVSGVQSACIFCNAPEERSISVSTIDSLQITINGRSMALQLGAHIGQAEISRTHFDPLFNAIEDRGSANTGLLISVGGPDPATNEQVLLTIAVPADMSRNDVYTIANTFAVEPGFSTTPLTFGVRATQNPNTADVAFGTSTYTFPPPLFTVNYRATSATGTIRVTERGDGYAIMRLDIDLVDATGRTAFVNGQIQVATGRYTPPCT